MQLYLRLVEWRGDDAAQQAAALRQCLICFGHDEGDHSDKALLPFLAQFLESQQVRVITHRHARTHTHRFVDTDLLQAICMCLPVL